MKFRILRFLTAAILFGVLPIPARLAAQNPSSGIITFDAPGASSVAGSSGGTFPKSINDAGVITGHYIDVSSFYHGFLRTPGGEFITLDAPGASSAAGSFDGTFPSSINSGGAIAGNYIGANDLNHGFLRSPEGEFTRFDAPGASSVAAFGFGTFPKSINDAGAITGYYADENGLYHGFLRTPEGEFTAFDAPGARSATGPGNGTVPTSINAGGAVTGHYADGNGFYHGFLRGPGGAFDAFDAPGTSSATGPGNGTVPTSINAEGVVTGHYVDARNVNHGFVRSPSGKFTTFDAPGAGTNSDSGFGTFPDSINDAGAITGHYTDAHGLNHGFLRIP